MIGSTFLPVTAVECAERGWDSPDFVYVTGDAYVDHPSFGVAIISRVLESEGFRVAILAQPDFSSAEDFKRFGRPRLGFLVTAGNIDSMVAHYTAAKKRRKKRNEPKGNGVVLDEAYRVLSDLIRLTKGEEVPEMKGWWF